MVSFSKPAVSFFAVAAAIVASVSISGAEADDLTSIKHVVYFMQENRAFDHYFGTMAGVRGFKDPNVKITDGLPVFYQPTASDEADYLLPWYLNEDPTYVESTQCMVAGSNDWEPNHYSWNNGKINGWVTNNTAWSWGHLRRSDVPTHWGIAEGWTVGDMYTESVIGPTHPNRASWVSGTINVPGSPADEVAPHEYMGGPFLENYDTDGCQTNGNVTYSCYPLRWNTTADYLEAAGIDWYVYQDEDNFDDNPFAWFAQFQDADEDDSMAINALSYTGLESFYEMAANGSLPAVSWIIGPAELTEHQPYMPKDGAWLQQKVVDAVTNGKDYASTVLFISYDETGGWGDHVEPFISPNGTIGEWFVDPEEQENYVPSGPGFRLPFYVISPWTRGSRVFTEPSDHSSQILFLEAWAEANGKSIYNEYVNPWRREHMSNLVNMFDFENPDYSIPEIANASFPSFNTTSQSWDGYQICMDAYPDLDDRRPPVPYGEQNATIWTESGYKQILGDLTEGRYLVFTQTVNGKQLSFSSESTSHYLKNTAAADDYSATTQRFVVVQVGNAFSHRFYIKSHHDTYLHHSGEFFDAKAEASIWTIMFVAGSGYSVYSEEKEMYLKLRGGSHKTPTLTEDASYFTVYSVTY
ncbi:hypothetical protein BZA70DRAFT_201110 [Myxozyma melibiosi]|uniref:Non-hemolytic phospholipase C n=1 Tax=Myxozyma melibiosi TaxID=54550 RepID=A0ABR1F2N6_9ASCO